MGQYNFEQIFFWSFHSELFRDGQISFLLIFSMNFVFLIFHDTFIFQKQSFGGTLWKRCSFKISQNSHGQNSACARVSFLIKSLFHRCFPVNFVNFFIEYLWWLLLIFLWLQNITSTFPCFFTNCYFYVFTVFPNWKRSNIVLILYSGIVFLYHLIVHYLGIWEFPFHLIFWFWKFKLGFHYGLTWDNMR